MMAEHCSTGIDSEQAIPAETGTPTRPGQIDYSDASVHIIANSHEI
jgi:hypothetical protein